MCLWVLCPDRQATGRGYPDGVGWMWWAQVLESRLRTVAWERLCDARSSQANAWMGICRSWSWFLPTQTEDGGTGVLPAGFKIANVLSPAALVKAAPRIDEAGVEPTLLMSVRGKDGP